MRIALAQVNPKVGDLDANYNKAIELAQQAKEQGADLIIYSAHFMTGLPLGSIPLESEAFMDELHMRLDSFAAQVPIRALYSSLNILAVDEGNRMVMPVPLIADGGKNYGLKTLDMMAFDDDTEGNFPVFNVDGHTCCVLVEGGFDIEGLPEKGLDLIVEMTADAVGEEEVSPFATGMSQRLKQIAQSSDAFAVYANLVGASDSMVFGGGSCVVDPFGRLVHSCSVSNEELFCFDTDGKMAQPEDETRVHMGKMEYLWTMISTATRDYVKKNGFTDVLVGLSGGIDSAVVGAVAVDALGAEHVHGVLMPGPYSSDGSVTDALELAKNLGIDTVTLSINDPVASVHQQLGEACGGAVEGLAAENLQARMRMIYLMTISNAKGWMLLNTGNKSEAAMGFSTLYGDTNGSYAPIGNVYKTRVFELARWRAAQSPSIPEAIILKPPSAELYPGAKDADRLPEYEELDGVLRLFIEGGLSATQIEMKGYPRETINRVLRAVGRNGYKREQEPLGPHVEGIAFDQRDWPITCAWDGTL